jgi:hypothetical protein
VLIAFVFGVELLGAFLVVGFLVQHFNEAVNNLDLIFEVLDFAVVSIDHLFYTLVLLQCFIKLGFHTGHSSIKIYLFLFVLLLDCLEISFLIFVLCSHWTDLIFFIFDPLLKLLYNNRELFKSFSFHNINRFLSFNLLVKFLSHLTEPFNSMLFLVIPNFFVRANFFLLQDVQRLFECLVL